MPGDVDVSHHIDRPDALPVAVGGLGSAGNGDAGVGAEDVDASMLGLDLLDESLDVSIIRDVALNRGRVDLFRNGARAIAVDVGDYHRFGALGGEASREGATDPTRRAGHDDDPPGQLHRNLINSFA